MIDLGAAVLNPMLSTAHIEHARNELRDWGGGISGSKPSLGAVVAQHGMDFVGDSDDQGFQEGGGRNAVCLLQSLPEGELAGASNGNKKIKLSFSGLHFGDVAVKIPNRIAFEVFLGWFVAFDLWQPGDEVSLQAAVRR